MNKNNSNNVVDFCSQISSGGAPVIANVKLVAPAKMVVKHRETKEPNPWLGKVTKVTTTRVQLGRDYESAVNNAQEKNGGQRDFVADLIPGRHHVNRMILESDTEPGKLYFQMYRLSNCPAKVEYQLEDGTTVPYEQVAPYLPAKRDDENPVKVFAPNIDIIAEITVGGKTFQ